MTNSKEVHEQMDYARKSIGLHLDPFSMFLLRRGIKTLPLRMERHIENAMAFSKHFEQHKKVKQILYPGLESHPQHEIAKKQMCGFSGMVSIIFDLDDEAVKKAMTKLNLITLAESLGAVGSNTVSPALTKVIIAVIAATPEETTVAYSAFSKAAKASSNG
jgi:cystathionine gamma-lyase